MGAIYLISDSLGETAEQVVRAALCQFDTSLEVRRIPYVTSLSLLEEVVAMATQEQSLIAYTLVLPQLRKRLKELAKKNGIPAVDLLGPTLEAIAGFTGLKPRLEPGAVRRLDEDYFRKTEAIEFAVRYDNGKDPRGIAHADVVLLGVSRTSKTPVCMYLALKRIRAANLALTPEVPLPEELLALPRGRIVGLTIDPQKLLAVRQERISTLGLPALPEYASMERIQAEVAYAESVMRRLGCPVIDVTNKAVEDTAGKILQIYQRREDYGIQ